MSSTKSVECSVAKEPELLSNLVDQTPAVSNVHDFTIHTSINDQVLVVQEEIMNLHRKLVTVEKRLFSLERLTKDPQMITFYTDFKD